jgi:hypothetical protein
MYWLDKWDHCMWWYFTCEHVSLFEKPLYYSYFFFTKIIYNEYIRTYKWWQYLSWLHVIRGIKNIESFWWRGANNGQDLVNDEEFGKTYAKPKNHPSNLAHNVTTLAKEDLYRWWCMLTMDPHCVGIILNPYYWVNPTFLSPVTSPRGPLDLCQPL